MTKLSRSLVTAAIASVLAIPITEAQAWWGPWAGGPWNSGWGDSGRGDGWGDGFGDFNLSLSGGGHGYGRGYGRGYGYGYPYGDGWGGSYGGWGGPYGWGSATTVFPTVTPFRLRPHSRRLRKPANNLVTNTNDRKRPGLRSLVGRMPIFLDPY
jgi:hypothetical protein